MNRKIATICVLSCIGIFVVAYQVVLVIMEEVKISIIRRYLC
jgi:hypothetical protein